MKVEGNVVPVVVVTVAAVIAAPILFTFHSPTISWIKMGQQWKHLGAETNFFSLIWSRNKRLQALQSAGLGVLNISFKQINEAGHEI